MTKFHHRAHPESHRTEHIGWLRAAVLGANDGIISTASLVAGVAAAHASHASIMTTAIAGLVAGAMSMAAGEFVSSIHKLIRRRRIWRGNVMNWKTVRKQSIGN